MSRLTTRVPQMRQYSGHKARVSIDGKYHYLGEWGSDQAKANYNRLITQWRKSVALQPIALGDRCLIAELCADYLDHVAVYFGDGHNRPHSTIPNHQVSPNRPLKPHRNHWPKTADKVAHFLTAIDMLNIQ